MGFSVLIGAPGAAYGSAGAPHQRLPEEVQVPGVASGSCFPAVSQPHAHSFFSAARGPLCSDALCSRLCAFSVFLPLLLQWLLLMSLYL